MIRHCSLWKFTDAAPADLVDRATEAFFAAADEIPSVRACQVGGNLGYLPTNHDFALTIDFDDLDGYREYVAHDLHMQLFREYLEPYLESRTAVQFELR
ncbi:Dabb family protein [Agromyces aerolatus]|uniref:Dabb family protein n=1 Tax=Agromyces sp. LY-1074 TaxID=3074080 RepID=UPI002859E55F|nr:MULTISPECIES: Dabb family protein [unclassified Agromyces]MDR5699128.1 Dabb family protein [Agromyces sp. LY-1074]MDR5705093.1 Dabb family protein [Agromyces sp. LY-1358]